MKIPDQNRIFRDKWKIGKESLSLSRLTFPFGASSILEFFGAQFVQPHCYFADPKMDKETLAMGEIYSTEEVPAFKRESETYSPYMPTLYGGRDFTSLPRKTKLWEGFPASYYFLPKFELMRDKGLCYFSITLLGSPTLEEFQLAADSICEATSPQKRPSTVPTNRTDAPHFTLWKSNVNKCLQLFKNKKAQKVVLARSTTFTFNSPLSSQYILRGLLGKAENSWVFSIGFSPEKTFIGSTPEHLYQKHTKSLHSMALAGTRPRGKTEQEDDSFQKELLETKKDIHEIDLVRKDIAKKFLGLCETIETGAPLTVIKTQTVQHLYHHFSGMLRKSIGDAEILRTLHPTPAVGGTPTNEACKTIRELELFDRGWYAAPIGWLSPQSSQQFVALRCALLDANKMHLFAGCGIVNGSNPKSEWEELEQKISQFIAW